MPPASGPASTIVTPWPSAAQVIRGGESRGTGADDEHALAALALRRGELPAEFDRLVAEEALDGVDADRLVELAAVARGLAGVIADAPHDRRQRIVLGELAPCGFVVARLRVVEPALDVLAGRAGVVARRQPIDVERPVGPPAPVLLARLEPTSSVIANGLSMRLPIAPGRTRRCSGRPSSGSARCARDPADCRIDGHSVFAA